MPAIILHWWCLWYSWSESWNVSVSWELIQKSPWKIHSPWKLLFRKPGWFISSWSQVEHNNLQPFLLKSSQIPLQTYRNMSLFFPQLPADSKICNFGNSCWIKWKMLENIRAGEILQGLMLLVIFTADPRLTPQDCWSPQTLPRMTPSQPQEKSSFVLIQKDKDPTYFDSLFISIEHRKWSLSLLKIKRCPSSYVDFSRYFISKVVLV